MLTVYQEGIISAEHHHIPEDSSPGVLNAKVSPKLLIVVLLLMLLIRH